VSDEQTRFPYKFGRVLIESERVITPTLPGVTLQLSGGQVEMLRNIVCYLGYRNAFVSEYFDIDYEAPDDDDWETITTLVADLEYKLMGNENVIWGYNDRYAENEENANCDAGVNVLTFSTVPVGEVWRITAMTWVNVTSACDIIGVTVFDGTTAFTVDTEPAPVANGYKTIRTDVILKAGDRIKVSFYGCTVLDDIYSTIVGYKMKV